MWNNSTEFGLDTMALKPSFSFTGKCGFLLNNKSPSPFFWTGGEGFGSGVRGSFLDSNLGSSDVWGSDPLFGSFDLPSLELLIGVDRPLPNSLLTLLQLVSLSLLETSWTRL